MNATKPNTNIFPPVDTADENGIVAWSQGVTTTLLYAAYSKGIFPWPHDLDLIPWFCPDPRAVLEFDNLHISRSLRRQLNSCEFEFRFNTAFKQVIEACAQVPRKGQDGTWIEPRIIDVYTQFHHQGYAVSFETLNRDNKLVGGMYGVLINGHFGGESMFHHETNASKFALINAVKHLKKIGLTWMDIQQITPLLKSFGATEISRKEFMTRLKADLEKNNQKP